MMKKTFIIAAMATMLASCSLIRPLDGSNTGGTYTSSNTSHPTTQGGYYTNGQQGYYQYGGNTANQHVTQNTGIQPGQHVTQQNNGYYNNGHVTQGQTNNYNSHPDSRRPITGDIVASLPSRGVQQVTVNGEKLYLYNGIYYKAVRTNSGTAYKVVGSTQR